MMKWTIFLLAALLLAGCGAPGQTAETPASTPPSVETQAPTGLWTATEMPISVRYERRWIYGAEGESNDSETIEALVSAIRALDVGAVSETVTEDYTDVLTFTFADGGTLRLEFEGGNVVLADGTRREVQGLAHLRALLDGMMDAEE